MTDLPVPRFVRQRAPVQAALALFLILGLAAARPAPAAQAQESASAGPLEELLRLAPDSQAGEGGEQTHIAAYADIAAQAVVAGVAPPASLDDPAFKPWVLALMPLTLPDQLIAYAMVADWRSLLGFDLWQIEQSLQIGEPPSVITLLRGRFDEDEIRAAWARQGYQLLDVGGLTVGSLHEDARFDVTTDLGRYGFARFNNAAILPDGTLAYSPTLAGLRAVIATAEGRAPALGDRVGVAALLRAVDVPLASALIVTGAALQGAPTVVSSALDGTPDPDQLATQDAALAEMPPITLALLGITPGGPLPPPVTEALGPGEDIPPARFQIALLLPTQPAAEIAADVVSERLEAIASISTGRPWSDLFVSWEVRALPDVPVTVIELTFAADVQPSIWLDLVVRRDLTFLG